MILSDIDWGTTSATGLTVVRLPVSDTTTVAFGMVYVGGQWHEVTVTASDRVVIPEVDPEERPAVPPWPFPPWPKEPALCEGPNPRAWRVGRRLAPARRRTSTGVRNWRARR